MSPTAEKLLKQVLTLDENDRGAEEAWNVEIRRRVVELESGTVKTVPWQEVRKRLFRGFE